MDPDFTATVEDEDVEEGGRAVGKAPPTELAEDCVPDG